MKEDKIANLIQIRNFIIGAIDNVMVKMTNEQVRVLRNKQGQIDQLLINKIMEFDVESLDSGKKK